LHDVASEFKLLAAKKFTVLIGRAIQTDAIVEPDRPSPKIMTIQTVAFTLV
jgi:hypothetical protein